MNARTSCAGGRRGVRQVIAGFGDRIPRADVGGRVGPGRLERDHRSKLGRQISRPNIAIGIPCHSVSRRGVAHTGANESQGRKWRTGT